MKLYFAFAAVLTVAAAAGSNQQYTTPVPILKQINKHNEDGSYSYGYEAADGTFKIETKYPDGEVFGKYGYVDDTGNLREVEYGASRRGFEPVGNEIQVPPPTLRQNPNAIARPLAPNEEDDGQYREDPAVYYANEPNNNQRAPQSRYYQPAPQPQPKYTQPQYQPTYRAPQPAYQPAPRPVYQPQPQPVYQPQPQPVFRPQPQYDFAQHQPRHYNPAPPAYPNYNSFQGHPASNVDINTGSYTVQYRR
ncbi:unnamed protein product [Brassicogethes aeneus]|uniref:Uncharacterized protein n=1 Tax=Brassicogethes aeneus TaxID=1431903 RepID=A0A9P0FF27_BRAAE|nr:unnamed protein product [Brassicogethes aeneus]